MATKNTLFASLASPSLLLELNTLLPRAYTIKETSHRASSLYLLQLVYLEHNGSVKLYTTQAPVQTKPNQTEHAHNKSCWEYK